MTLHEIFQNSGLTQIFSSLPPNPTWDDLKAAFNKYNTHIGANIDHLREEYERSRVLGMVNPVAKKTSTETPVTEPIEEPKEPETPVAEEAPIETPVAEPIEESKEPETPVTPKKTRKARSSKKKQA